MEDIKPLTEEKIETDFCRATKRDQQLYNNGKVKLVPPTEQKVITFGQIYAKATERRAVDITIRKSALYASKTNSSQCNQRRTNYNYKITHNCKATGIDHKQIFWYKKIYYN